MPRSIELIRFNTLRNALYHTARRRTFERWSRWFNFAIVVLGTAAFGDVLIKFGAPEFQIYVGAAVAVVGALQLVFDFGGAARTHQSLQRDYYNLLGDIEETVDCTENHCARWEGKLARIAGDEPPVYRALDAKAYNDAIGALEIHDDDRLVIPFVHRLAGSFWAYEGYTYEKKSEVAARAAAKVAARKQISAAG